MLSLAPGAGASTAVFTVLATALAGAAFGLAPAPRATRTGIAPGLEQSVFPAIRSARLDPMKALRIEQGSRF